MKKELFVAIILGLSMGLIITYGIYRAQQVDTRQQAAILEIDTEELADISDLQNTLIIDSPKDESVVDQQNISVAGQTLPGAFVVIYVNEDPVITSADSTGAFSITARLRTGANVISVHSIAEDGTEVVADVVVSYTTEPITRPLADDDQEDSDENDQEDEEESS